MNQGFWLKIEPDSEGLPCPGEVLFHYGEKKGRDFQVLAVAGDPFAGVDSV